MGGKSTPDAPDYRGAAQEEAQASRENLEQQTWANRPTQINPWGRVDWSNTPQWDPTTQQYINRWTQETTLDPRLMGALESQLALQRGRSDLGAGMMGQIGADLGDPMDFSRYGAQTSVGAPDMLDTSQLPGRVADLGQTQYTPEQLQRNLDFSGASQIDAPEFTRQAAEDSLYNRQAQRLDQQFGGEEEALRIRMRNQGLAPGDQAWESQMQDLNQRKTDAYQGAQAQAMQLGGQEAQRMFDMQSALRGQQTGEASEMGQFANQAALGQFGMMSQAQQQAFQDRARAGEFQNQARDQMVNELMTTGRFNQDQAYRFADYQNQLRQNAMNEELMQRSQRLNEANALISGQQVNNPQFQPFQSAGVAAAPNLLQAASLQGQQAAANQSAQNQMFGNLLGGATSLATGGMMRGFF